MTAADNHLAIRIESPRCAREVFRTGAQNAQKQKNISRPEIKRSPHKRRSSRVFGDPVILEFN